jgi:DNA polymerase III subunit epsilon
VKHFTGKDLAGAHQAMADVQGCMAVWFALQDLFEVSAA